jgi:hypothetical protein
MYLDAAGQPTVVLNSLKSAFNLLDRRASNYSDRPRFIMAQEILNNGLVFVFLNYGDRLVLLWFLRSSNTKLERSHWHIGGVACVVLRTKPLPRGHCKAIVLFRPRRLLSWFHRSLHHLAVSVQISIFSVLRHLQSCPLFTTTQQSYQTTTKPLKELNNTPSVSATQRHRGPIS